jgi:hypothetical protein
VLLTAVNCYSVPLAVRLQSWTSLGKVAAMSVVLVSALLFVTIIGF